MLHDMDEFIFWNNAADNSPSGAAGDQQVDTPISLPLESNAVPFTPDLDPFRTEVNDGSIGSWALSYLNSQQSQYSPSDTPGSEFDSSSNLIGSLFHPTSMAPLNPSSLLPSEPILDASDNPYIGFSDGNPAFGSNTYHGHDDLCDFPGRDGSWHMDTLSTPDVAPTSYASALAGSPGILSHSSTPASLARGSDESTPSFNKNRLPAKIGSRFSRESVQILKRWLALNSHEPYPSEEENAMLQRQTGLKKSQISNWFANARRRGKVQTQSPNFHSTGQTGTEPIDVPSRPDTPAVKHRIHDADPLQRWVDSPPESEPASVTAIARAVASDRISPSGSKRSRDFSLRSEEPQRPFRNTSSASSAGTSSGSSLASSHVSDHSLTSFGSINKSHGRRRRRNRIFLQRRGKTSLIVSHKPYQCTFCPETFRTKHDWQRHEKSLHLSLEKWICEPDGPRVVNPSTGQVCCAFCGQVNPNEDHITAHNYSVCEGRPFEEKTFYRKDHLNQHLKLVHGVMFLDQCMNSWKVVTSKIHSRCGFCGISMDTWPARVDHLAEHYKNGNTIHDWKGDWGFDDSTLGMLQNAIPPYLIETERNSLFPHVATRTPERSPTTAYGLITLELAYFIENFKEDTGSLPNDEEIQLEACRVIFASEASSLQGISAKFSWLRDLVMGSEEIARKAQFAPLRRGPENSLSKLKINGKDNLFDSCPLEVYLNEFVLDKTSLGLTVTDAELQDEACHLIRCLEKTAQVSSEFTADWFVRLIRSSTAWLTDFRRRVYLPLSEAFVRPKSCPTNSNKLSPAIFGNNALEIGLSDYLDAQSALGLEPSNEDLGREARKIISNSDGRDQSAAENLDWLTTFRHLHTERKMSTKEAPLLDLSSSTISSIQQTVLSDQATERSGSQDSQFMRSAGTFENMMKKTFFLNDSNCYRRLAQDLTRFVKSSMAPNNPNRHVPTDAEIQHQARWILFDSDDPWNQTAADNDEWLQRFKRGVGILPPS